MPQKLITISGQLGSGKSTVAKLLAQKLGYEYYSTGMAQRRIADEKGISTIELNEISKKDPSIDQQIDGIYQQKPWGEKPCIVDSRLAFHFLPHSFKVRLKVDLDTAAQRVFNAKRPTEKYTNIQEAKISLEKRTQLEKERFIKTYQVDITDDTLFDLVIDTSSFLPEEICQKIIEKI